MARLNIEDEYWGDNRRAQLAIKLGCQFKADGVMTNAWKLAQKFWSLDKKLIPKKHWIEAGMPDAVFEVKFADDRGDYVYVRGTEEKFSWYVERQEAAKKGGAASANKRWPSKRQAKVDQTVTKSNQSLSKSKQSVTKRKQTQPSSSFSSSSSTSTSFSNSASSNLAPGVSDETAPPPELPISLELVEEPKTKATWCSYKEAYRTKYGEEPVWNAKVGGQLSQFVDRLGREESPQVAAFYFSTRRTVMAWV